MNSPFWHAGAAHAARIAGARPVPVHARIELFRAVSRRFATARSARSARNRSPGRRMKFKNLRCSVKFLDFAMKINGCN
ncbi:hypothetical protein [Burkholderia thailandensis]|uniref:hypothetical protein n=1 Tax=Burkholderia thailandensis TaxID=57975 RepID=UPI000FD659FF|nr:hypothetical protein [Burkholderia thailandensis]NBC91228.1 hypothetical protein [Burkholderia thailandensis]